MANVYESDTDHIHEHKINYVTDKIDPMIKVVINQISDKNPQIKPKQIRVLVNMNLDKYPTLKDSTVPEL